MLKELIEGLRQWSAGSPAGRRRWGSLSELRAAGVWCRLERRRSAVRAAGRPGEVRDWQRPARSAEI